MRVALPKMRNSVCISLKRVEIFHSETIHLKRRVSMQATRICKNNCAAGQFGTEAALESIEVIGATRVTRAHIVS